MQGVKGCVCICVCRLYKEGVVHFTHNHFQQSEQCEKKDNKSIHG